MNDTLERRIRKCTSLPSLPAIAIQVLELAQDSEADITEIARIISKDSALSSKILRTVNSSFYSLSQHVSTISRALVILGLQSVKTLVLGFSLVSNLVGGKEKGFKHVDYWRRSIFSATAARAIAAHIKLPQQEEAFLAALLKDIGMLVLDQVLGAQYGEINSQVEFHADLPAMERDAIKADHAEVGAFIATTWKLPPVLTLPISHHHYPKGCTDPAMQKLVDVVHLASRCADVFVDANPSPALSHVRELCQAQFQMNEADTDALLTEIGTKTKETASLFEIKIGADTSFDSILKKANETLVELTLATQQQATSLQKEAVNLAEQNVELKKKATTDALTELANRATFDEFLVANLATSIKESKPLSLLMLDLDKFKSINDKHGHPTGDQVLLSVGAILKGIARQDDLAARYGGEEMCLILPNTARAQATVIAENLRRVIAAKPIVKAPTNLTVTASIGVATFEPNGPPAFAGASDQSRRPRGLQCQAFGQKLRSRFYAKRAETGGVKVTAGVPRARRKNR